MAACYCVCNTASGIGTPNLVTGDPGPTNQNCVNLCSPQTVNSCVSPTAGGSTTGGSSGGVVLKDPLNLPAGDPTALWARLIGALLGFVGVGALITFVYAGFMFLTSSGNPEQVKKAKDTMIYAVLGVAVSMGAYVILSYIFDILQGATS